MIIAVRYQYTAGRDLSGIRPAHRAFLRGLLENGTLITSGPLPATDAALLILDAHSPEAALQLLEDDPILIEGCVDARTAEEWQPVLGALAPRA